MAGAEQQDDVVPPEGDTDELVAQIRELVGSDPAEVRQVVAEVLAALDRVAGGALRDQLPAAIRLAPEHRQSAADGLLTVDPGGPTATEPVGPDAAGYRPAG